MTTLSRSYALRVIVIHSPLSVESGRVVLRRGTAGREHAPVRIRGEGVLEVRHATGWEAERMTSWPSDVNSESCPALFGGRSA